MALERRLRVTLHAGVERALHALAWGLQELPREVRRRAVELALEPAGPQAGGGQSFRHKTIVFGAA
jgi:hypothetical protein